MSDGLQLLRDVCEGAAEVAPNGAMPPSTLRFVLEYRELPRLDEERDRISELLGTRNLTLEFLFNEPVLDDDEDGVFVVLSIPGLERTTSRPGLFSMSYGLADELNLLSVEPDLGTDLYTDDQPGGGTGELGAAGEAAVGGVVSGLCFVKDTAPPADRQWALKTMKVDRAWDIATTRGAGVLIGQPDTGVAAHDELEAGSVDLARGIDIVDGDDDPTDPRSGGGNPGHGTGTASVAISRETNPLSGSAPAATVVPIRCIETVTVFNAAPVARAIDHARSSGCHIVTMSLGGLPSWGLYRAVKRAVRNDMIVLAAAGNCVKTVVWPARFDDVIAVAGCNEQLQPWKGTSRGDAVDVTAPAELVWKAQFNGDTGAPEIDGGQGTSFAVALTAGVAALWLGHHGIQNVIDEADRQGLSVQELFRRLLRKTAHTPNGWDTNELGTGIVNAEALLQAPLDGAEGQSRTPGTRVPETVNERLGTSIEEDDASLDWRRFNREVASMVTEDLRRGAGPGVETTSERISPELREALDGASSQDLGRLVMESTAVRQAKTPTAPPSARATARPVDPAQLVATSRSIGLESSMRLTSSQARESLSDDLIDAKVNALKERFDAAELGAPGSTSARAGLKAGRKTVLDDAARVMQDLRDGKEIEQDDIGGRTSLEALVKLEGRPVIPLLGDRIDLNDSRLGAWQEQVALVAPSLETARASVGRIDVNGVHAGTGFVVGPAHVLTNRHVVETMATAVPGHQNPDRWVLEGHATINFDPLAVDADRRFRINEVIFAGPDRILGAPINFSKLDLALLEVEETNAVGAALPAALAVSRDAMKTETADNILVLGYPAAPTDLPHDEDGQLRMDVVNLLHELFGLDYSVQYLSPGAVLENASALANSPRSWVFSHDATSLGGSSGSCVFTYDREFAVSGLHFAGDWLHANFAHDFAALNADQAALPDSVRAVLFGDAQP